MRYVFWIPFLLHFSRCSPSMPEAITFNQVWTSPVRPDQHYPKHFSNEEGEYVYVLNKTAWAYFVCVYWTWHSWDGCKGINDTTYVMEGWQYLPLMKEYYSKTPFWKLFPNQTVAGVKGESLV